MNNKAAIIDLDGTLVDCNSFTLYVKRMMWRHPRIILYALARKLRLVSHAQAKEWIMGVPVSDKELQTFVDELVRHVRREVFDLGEGMTRVLATAAPYSYSSILAKRLGFDHIIGSHKGKPECKGVEKLKGVQALCERESLEVALIATDHDDDLPLLNAYPNSNRHIIRPHPTKNVKRRGRSCAPDLVLQAKELSELSD